MSATYLDESYLLSQLHEFYAEIIRLKQAVRSKAEAFAPGRHPGEGKAEGVTAQYINTRLLRTLEAQAVEAARRGGEYGAIFFKEAQYIMAVLGDETFLHLDWEGREEWKSNLLEFRFFATHTAGEVFFKKVDRLLADRDPAKAEIALLYLIALSLGFQGKYRGLDGKAMLDNYRRQLYSFIYHRNPDLLGSSKTLFPASYAYTLEEGVGKRLPDVRRWLWVLLLVVVLFLVLSHGLWDYMTRDLERILGEIIASKR